MSARWVESLFALALSGCLGSVDPASFSNFASRVELVSETSFIIPPSHWLALRPGLGKLVFVSHNEGLGVLDYEYPLTPYGFSKIVSISRTSIDGAVCVEVDDYLLVAGASCCGPFNVSDFAGVVVSLAPDHIGDIVTQAMLPEARNTRGRILAGSYSTVAFQTEEPPGLAFFDLTGLPQGQLPFLGFADDPAFQKLLGGALYERGNELYGFGVGPDRLVSFQVGPGYQITLGRELKLRPPGEERLGSITMVHAGILSIGRQTLVTDGAEKLFVVDLEDPLSPQVLGRLSGFSQALTIARITETDFALVANGMGGVVLINLRDPTNPQLLNISRMGHSRTVSTYGPYGYSAGELSLEVLKLFSPSEF